MPHKLNLLTLAAGAALLSGQAAALPLSTASLAYNGTINFNTSSGLSVVGDLDAQYRTPTGGPKPYQFNTSLGLGSLTVTPVITVTTPTIVLIPGTTICLPFFGCNTTPDITLPSQTIPLNPTIPLTDPISIYDYSYTSSALPLGGIFNLDFGSLLLGDSLTLGNVVQAQFETGATTVSESGSLGPIEGSYQYEGVLQPGNTTILGSYVLDITGPGLLGELEGFALGILNDNSDLLFDLAFGALLASNPCGGLTVGQGICNDLINGLGSTDLQVTVNSIGNFSTDFSLLKSIVPVPAPATLPLLALGIALAGLASRRRASTRA